MVVPVDADVNEAQDIAEENRKEWLQGRKTGSLWRLHFQHHDGDDDGEYPVTKSLHAALGHPSYSFFGLRVKREQPVTGRRFPHRLGIDAGFSQKDPRVYFTRRFFGFMYEILECALHYRSRFQNKLPLSFSDMISAGEPPNPLGLFPLGLVPAELLGANEAPTTSRP